MLIGTCGGPPAVRFHEPDSYPQRLSEWGVLTRAGDGYRLGAGVLPYEINTPLFTDHAQKLRTIYLPPGSSAGYAAEGPFDFPVGSIISKTFFYPVENGVAQARSTWRGDPDELGYATHQVLETRLLVRQPHGWDALPYVWDGDDATLRLAGAIMPLELALEDGVTAFPYLVPTRNECAGCHATDHASGALQPIGIRARHLNRTYPGQNHNQLDAWHDAGLLADLPAGDQRPRAADWLDTSASLETRARAYLDSNCGHCHSPTGPGATSGLFLDAHTTNVRQLGFCKRPIAAGRGSGGHRYSIVPGEPAASILIFRMETTDPAMRMPELGRSLVHQEGVELMRDWISSLPGACV